MGNEQDFHGNFRVTVTWFFRLTDKVILDY